MDSTIECTELAIREFIASSQSQASLKEYIQQLSAKHRIRVDDVNLEYLKVRAAQLYIIAVYQQAEDFLESFRDEHPLADTWKYEDKDNLFKAILKNIGKGYQEARTTIGALEVDLFDYYRLVRNRFVHPEIDESKFSNKVQQLQQAVAASEYGKLKAPNIYHEISFDDFILFTRVIKRISRSLCVASRPTDVEIASTAASIIREHKRPVEDKLKRIRQNPKRTRNALMNLLRELYGLGRIEAEPVAELLQNDLLAQWQSDPLHERIN